MFGLTMLDVLIGLVTIYLTFGLACTAIVEAIIAWGGVRSKKLEDALRELMDGKLNDSTKFVDAFFDHPIVQSLSKGKSGRPSYIPKELVGKVVESIVMAGNSSKDLISAIDALPSGPDGNRVKDILKSCVSGSAASINEFRQTIEMHFDASVQRASGWFKRYAQNVTIVVAMVIVFSANVDSLAIAKTLSTSPEIRLKLVQLAEQQLQEANANSHASEKSQDALVAAKAETAEAKKSLKSAQQSLESAGLPFGWEGQPTPKGWDWLKKLVGLLISGFAISLGAPFWFDVLKTFMNVRSSGGQAPAAGK